MKKRLLFALLAAMWFSAGPAWGQSFVVANLTAASASQTACPTSACRSLLLSGTTGTVSVALSGTWVGTVQFEVTANGTSWAAISGDPVSGGSAVSSATAGGTWLFNVAALQRFQVRVSAYTSGTIVARVTSSTAFVKQLGSGGSGTPGGADTQVQFNDAGSFGGDADLVWNKTSDLLSIRGDLSLNPVVATGAFIRAATSDGADNRAIVVTGGGSYSDARGAGLLLAGNEHSDAGDVLLNAGNVAGADITFLTGGLARAAIDASGNFNLTSATASSCARFDASKNLVSATGDCFSGSGSANTIAKFTAGTALGNSVITDNGTTVAVGGTNFSFPGAAGAAPTGEGLFRYNTTNDRLVSGDGAATQTYLTATDSPAWTSPTDNYPPCYESGTAPATLINCPADGVSAPVFCSDAGASDTYACSLSPAPAAYVTGTHYRFKANTANTGAASINFNSLGARTIVKAAGGITTALSDNDIRAGQWVDLIDDGSNMQMQSTLGNAAAGGGGAYSMGFASSAVHSPVDSTSYYFGVQGRSAITTAEQRYMVAPQTGTLTKACFGVLVEGTLGDAALGTATLRRSNADIATISAAISYTAATASVCSGALSVAITAGDLLEIKIASANWVTTNPTSVAYSASIYVTVP